MSGFFNNNDSLPLQKITTYKHYEGLLDSHKLFMDLSISNAEISATYFIDSTEEVLDIFGRIYNNDSVFLEDYKQNYSSKENYEMNNYFKGKIIGDRIEGIFIAPKKIVKFQAKEITSGIVKADFLKIADSTLHPVSKKVIIHEYFESPIFMDNEFIYENISKLMGDSTFHGSYKNFIDKKTKFKITDFSNAELADMEKKPYLSADYCYIMYNKNNRLILSNSKMLFWTGMHENFEIQFCTIDMKNKKVLTLKDVLQEEEIKKLPLLLEKKFRNIYGLSEKDSLSKILYYNDNRFLNNTYYITEKGIGFLYNPHEIASFSNGPISLYIPFADIRK
jgi:hypothetical protein